MDYTAKLGFFFIQVWKKPFHDVSNGTRWNVTIQFRPSFL